MRFPRSSYWILVAIAVVMVLGHICALPFHAHAGAITTHEERQSHHGTDSPDEDAVHVGSCDVVKSAPTALDGIVLVLLGSVAAVAQEWTRQLCETHVAAIVLDSPPLFLLHASLLI
jgi:hypothetical protein